MNSLSPLVYYRRHLGHTAMLLGLISLMAAGLYLMVSLSSAVFIEPARTNRLFLSKFSVVMPRGDEFGAAVAAQIRTNPDVAQVLPIVFSQAIYLPEVIGGSGNSLNLLGLRETDLQTAMSVCGATVTQGQMLAPHTAGIMLSEQVARNLGVGVGDTIHRSVDPRLYGNIFDPMTVVALLDSEVRLGIISYEYLESHEIYRLFPTRYLVIPQQGRESVVDAFLRDDVRSAQTGVWTLQTLNAETAEEYRATYLVLLPIVGIVAIAIALIVGVVNRIAFTRRIPEFGILHATGHSRHRLAHRLTIETLGLTVLGWTVGVLISWSVLHALKAMVFVPRGHDLAVLSPMPTALTALVPIVTVAFTRFSADRLLARLDAVTIVERGELAPDVRAPGSVRAPQSRQAPLSALTFLSRHRGRTVLLTGATTLMIVAVAFAVFIFAATEDAQLPGLQDLLKMSLIHVPFGSTLDLGVLAQVRNHPTVDRVIPTVRMTMLDISIPPLDRTTINPFAAASDDLAYLVALNDLELLEGYLPHPNTNEIVIPEAVAQNRGLHVGDVIGSRDHPAYPGAPILPAEFVVSGILARSDQPEEENWLSFVSLEFLEDHEAFGFLKETGLFIVVPKPGAKPTMDSWLQTKFGLDTAIGVTTYDQSLAYAHRNTQTFLMALTLLEGVVAAVAAVGLAILNTIALAQRKSEFGVLHALGYGRRRLTARALGQTAFTTVVAWAISAVLGLTGLWAFQVLVFAPLGLKLSFLSPVPWLATLPIPAAVVVATAMTVTRTLSRLDAVSIIERRGSCSS